MSDVTIATSLLRNILDFLNLFFHTFLDNEILKVSKLKSDLKNSSECPISAKSVKGSGVTSIKNLGQLVS